MQLLVLIVLLNTRSLQMALLYAGMRGITSSFEAIQGGVVATAKSF